MLIIFIFKDCIAGLFWNIFCSIIEVLKNDILGFFKNYIFPDTCNIQEKKFPRTLRCVDEFQRILFQDHEKCNRGKFLKIREIPSKSNEKP